MQNKEQTNNAQAVAQSDNEFNNLESIESIYPAESIDISDCVSQQLISSDNHVAEPDQRAANDTLAPGQIYSLDNARLIKQSRSQERRSCKSQLTDRRSSSRIDANGEVQPDRREANRIANVESIRQAHSERNID